MATIKITEKQLKNTLSLQLINCNSFVNTLYKYMTASRVLDILEKEPHQIGFVSPEKWYDPYETKFLNTDYTKLNGYEQPKIYCFCARMDNRNEEASWKIYKKENEPLLRMSIRTIDFLLCLDKFAKEHECDLYFSRVDYRLKKKEIDELYQDAIKDYMKDGVLFVPVSVEMILRFTFYPANKSNESLASQIDKAKYEAEYKLIKERLSSSYPEAKVYKSNLYSGVKKIEKIEV